MGIKDDFVPQGVLGIFGFHTGKKMLLASKGVETTDAAKISYNAQDRLPTAKN